MNFSLNDSATTCTVVAPSGRQALRLMREKLGPDAFVGSMRSTANGIEVTCEMDVVVPLKLSLTVTAADTFTQPDFIKLQATPFVGSVDGIGKEDTHVLREIHSMRGMIEEQLAGIVWSEAQRRDPVRGHLLRTLLGAGFSARLAKQTLSNLPTGQSYAAGLAYVKATLASQLPLLDDEDALMDEGGVYALMGPTGVGKTTTTAKLAARCVMRFGPQKLALVTTDSYRIGAFEQLRIYGQILGVSVHAVKDAADLERVLTHLHDKHMVLIDTVGRSQRDRAVTEQIAMLCGASRPVKRLLLLNASSHGDTLNEVVQAYRDIDQAGQKNDLIGCIFTKFDEATHPAALIDIAIRHSLPVHYVCDGQKVPEHLMLCDKEALIESVFQAKSPSALFVPGEADLDERPEPLGSQAELAEAQTVSARLRLQCQQLIRALTHNAEELTSSAYALSTGKIGFDESRSLWRQLADGQLGEQAVANILQVQARAAAQAQCGHYVLTCAGEAVSSIGLDSERCTLLGHLALSDRTGLPLAAPVQWCVPDGLVSVAPSIFDKPTVQLLVGVPKAAFIEARYLGGIHWAASVTGDLRVVVASSGLVCSLAKLVPTLAFGDSRTVTMAQKTVVVSVAQEIVSLHRELVDGVDCQEGDRPVKDDAEHCRLRCIVKRTTDAASGKLLSHSYVLVNGALEAAAQQIAQWPAWRVSSDKYFKLLNQSTAQFAEVLQSGVPTMKTLLVVGQVCATVFRLQATDQAWVEPVRQVLTQLAGRTGRAGRTDSSVALLEGLLKLFGLLDALQINDDAETIFSAQVALQGAP